MSDYRDTLLEMKAEALRCKAITERYAALHNLLGFPLTERLMRLVKGRRPQPA